MTSTRPIAAVLFACVVLGFATLPGCSGKKAHPEHPVVLIGVDGMEWKVMGPLVRDGKLPNLRKLIERGVVGHLATFNNNALSPVIWTTIATGTGPAAHGIVNFLDRDGTPFTSNSRRGKALWNIASDYGLKTICVGWWVTYPAEEINGFLVAPYSAAGQNAENWKGNLRDGKDLADQTWPRDLIDEIFPIAARLNDKERFLQIDAPYFGGVDLGKLDEVEDHMIAQTRWSELADESFTQIATHLLREKEKNPNLTMVYLGGPDVSSHRFWRYRSPKEFQYEIPAEAIAELNEIIHRFYIRTDELIGQVLAAAPADANVIVCSDHGFHAEFRDKPHPLGLSGHHLDGPPGVFIAAGPAVQDGPGRDVLAAKEAARSPLPNLGSVLQVAPTVLYLLDIPAGRNMESPNGGKLLHSIVTPAALTQRPIADAIESHDLDFRAPSRPKAISEGDSAGIQKWMEELGYLQSTNSNFQINAPKDEKTEAGGEKPEQKSEGG